MRTQMSESSPASTEPLQRPRWQWEADSICRKMPGNKIDEIFFTGKKGRPAKEPAYKKICGACPVAYECLNYAIVHNVEGVWGGFTKNQRGRLPVQFVQTLRDRAALEGWYEPLPDVDSLVRKLMHRPNSQPSHNPVDLWEIESPLDHPIPMESIRPGHVSMTALEAESLALFGFC